jgi:hypothetical protein
MDTCAEQAQLSAAPGRRQLVVKEVRAQTQASGRRPGRSSSARGLAQHVVKCRQPAEPRRDVALELVHGERPRASVENGDAADVHREARPFEPHESRVDRGESCGSFHSG